MGGLQPTHLAIVALVAFLVFGPKRLPELARGLGDSMREFQRSLYQLGREEPPAAAIWREEPGLEAPSSY
jgi:sec-independent protein translocase protein TatA